MRILITGSAGFIGYHICERLLAQNHAVFGLDNLNDYYDVSLKEARLSRLQRGACFSFARCDIADSGNVLKHFKTFRPDYVVHLAAQAGVRYSLENPFAYTHSNIDGFLSILEACRRNPVRHLIYASSSSVYGANTKVPFCETDPVENPHSLYAATKCANELMAQTYARLFRIPTSGLRFFTVYGPWGRPDMAYYGFTRAILEGRPIDVYHNGQMRRDFTYIDDVIDSLEQLIIRPPSDDVPHTLFNIGNNTPVELNEFINQIEQAVGHKAIRRFLPMQPGDVPVTWADVAKLSSAVGFSPHTPLGDGIRQFVEWYLDYHKVSIAI